MTRRSGMSLTEVLVALFILTLGVIGILTMFPLGAAQMARAVRDDRSALAAQHADAYMRWYWQTNVITPAINANLASSGTNYNPLPYSVPANPMPQDVNLSTVVVANPSASMCLFDNPAASLGNNTVVAIGAGTGKSGTLPAINLSQPNAAQVVSYPVIVDPMGFFARGQLFGDTSPTGYAAFARCGLYSYQNQNPAPPAKFYYRICSLTDTIGFNDNGTPTNDLEMRYNWMWVLQRPQMIQENSIGPTNLFNNASNTVVVNMTVVVFDRRAFGFPTSGVQGFESVMPANFTSGVTTVQIINPASVNNALDLKPGTWVMDASSNPAAVPFPIRQANFYRVVSVNYVTIAGVTTVSLELQTPVAPPTGYQPLGYTWQGTLIALNGVSGVFVRPPLMPYPQ